LSPLEKALQHTSCRLSSPLGQAPLTCMSTIHTQALWVSSQNTQRQHWVSGM
jgi:hypothetical protein